MQAVKEIFSDKKVFTIINILILLSMFIFLYNRLRYSVILNDDMMDIITRTFLFSHGRFIFEYIAIVTIKLIPDLFGINYQNFAFTQGILKSGVFCLLIYTVSLAYYRFKPKDFSICLLTSLSFFTILSVLIQLDFVWSFDTYQFFMGYIGCSMVYFWFFYIIADSYINNKTFSGKKNFLTYFLTFLVAQSNEFLSISTTIFLILLLIDDYICKKQINKFFLKPLIILGFLSIIVYLSNGSTELWDGYHLGQNFIISYGEIINFLKLLFKTIVLNNAFIIIPLIIYLILLFIKKEYKIFKYFMYSNLGFLLFLTGTFFLGKTCYHVVNLYPDNNWWFLYPGLRIIYITFLYTSTIFLLGFISAIDIKKQIKYSCIIFFIACCLFQIITHFDFKRIVCMHSYKHTKTMMYIDDKIALSYIKRNKTIVLPAYQPFYILPAISPKNLAASPEFYSKVFNKDEARYLIYLEKNYHVNVNTGVTFKDNKTAIKEYLKNGGTLTKTELKNLNFSNIKI